ncbi:MAG: DUF711 family protein [Chloroflexi bacterium]|nr:DUF711 family protein [Chloroflexota bacterium]
MKIRSVTTFVRADETLANGAFDRAALLNRAARETAADAGFVLQTTRLAAQPLEAILRETPALEFGRAFETLYRKLGFEYGALLVSSAELYGDASALVQATTSLFVSLAIASRANGIQFDAIQAAARTIHTLAHASADGLYNFRFAASANVPPNVPFFPTAYAGDDAPSFAFATEAADLAVDAFTNARSLDDAQTRLVNALESHAARVEAWGARLQAQSGVHYAGIDFSMAPYPDEGTSLATALERLTGARFGTRGTLFAASFVTDTLRRAKFTRAGFSTLMLPMLEDWTMARRSHENLYSLDSLLLYSTVCGAGLDTIPLAGDVSEHEIAALLLDLAALAVKLDKPLTARLVPVPNVRAGESTQFDFEYFANARAFGIDADAGMRILNSEISSYKSPQSSSSPHMG